MNTHTHLRVAQIFEYTIKYTCACRSTPVVSQISVWSVTTPAEITREQSSRYRENLYLCMNQLFRRQPSLTVVFQQREAELRASQEEEQRKLQVGAPDPRGGNESASQGVCLFEWKGRGLCALL